MRKILAIESTWYPRSPLSVKPLLDVLQHSDGIEVIYYKADTIAQFDAHVQALAVAAQPGDILYIAAHGESGRFYLKDKRRGYAISHLAETMGLKFEGCLVILSSCSLLEMFTPNDSALFFDHTHVAAIVGYTKVLDWVVSAAVDMIFLCQVQVYSRLPWFWKHFRREFISLIRATGMELIFPP